MEEEKRQRRNFEKVSLLLLFLSLVLLAVVAAGALRFGAVSSERDSEQARAQSNGTAARGLASRVKRVCARSGVCRVCLARPVSAARKGRLVWTAGMVLMVRLGWLALLVRRVLLA